MSQKLLEAPGCVALGSGQVGDEFLIKGVESGQPRLVSLDRRDAFHYEAVSRGGVHHLRKGFSVEGAEVERRAPAPLGFGKTLLGKKRQLLRVGLEHVRSQRLGFARCQRCTQLSIKCVFYPLTLSVRHHAQRDLIVVRVIPRGMLAVLAPATQRSGSVRHPAGVPIRRRVATVGVTQLGLAPGRSGVDLGVGAGQRRVVGFGKGANLHQGSLRCAQGVCV